jgi:hypothetical protein
VLRTVTATAAAATMLVVCAPCQVGAEMVVGAKQPTQRGPVDVESLRIGPAAMAPGAGGASQTAPLRTARSGPLPPETPRRHRTPRTRRSPTS